MKNDNVSKLKWFLGFLKTDLNSLELEDKRRLAEELRFITTGFNYQLRGQGNTKELISAIATPDLTKCQKELRKKAKNILSFIRRKQTEKISNSGKETQNVSPNGPMLFYRNLHGEQFTPIEPISSISAGYTVELYATENSLGIAELFGVDNIKGMIFQFLRCFEGIPINSFLKCRECEEWFVHLAKRKKYYCTSKCASRHIVRETRREEKEANSQKYVEEKEKGRKRARKSYEKKVRSENPKAKIKHRSRKYKEGE